MVYSRQLTHSLSLRLKEAREDRWRMLRNNKAVREKQHIQATSGDSLCLKWHAL